MPRVNHVTKARKSPGSCGKCHVTINPGNPYKWIKFRYGGKVIRCGSCVFRPSDLTQSKLSQVYAAQESIEDYLDGWGGDLDDLRSEVDSAAEQIREVAQEYEDAADAMGEAGEQHRENADELNGWVDGTIENLSLDEFEGEKDDDDEPKDAEAFDTWKQGIVDEVTSAFGECPL